MSVSRTKRRFQLVLIKPSHYDDEGYVVQRIRSSIPANSLACLYALAQDAAERQVLGPDVAIDITAVDETNTRIRAKEIMAQFARHDGFGMVCLVGVESNQLARALDIARPLRGVGLPVVIGGGHLAMLLDTQTDLQAAVGLGCTLFAGNAENGRIDAVLRDAASGALQPMYDQVDALPALESTPSPFLPPEVLKRVIDHYASFDAGRGCPFQCSFCALIDVQARKPRRHSADSVEQSIRAHYREAVPWFFITDESFVRNKDWEQVFDRIIQLREHEKIELNIVVQIDALCHKIPNFVTKAARAGVRKVFIDPENANRAKRLTAKKHQSGITECRDVLLTWRKAGVTTYEGRILDLPNDALVSVREGVEIIEKGPSADGLEFFCYAAASSRIRRAESMESKHSAR